MVVTSSVSVHSGSSSSIGSSDCGALTVHTEATKARQTSEYLFELMFGHELSQVSNEQCRTGGIGREGWIRRLAATASAANWAR